ncbi:MAG: hypothetical protein QME12_02710 [Nanoarchaeota archaeon]|nr:hypothetical protein [Nanoarchaeota archaeon]
MKQDNTLLEKEVMDEKKTLKLEEESVSKLFSGFSLDFSCYTPLIQSSPSCRGSAYSFMVREKPMHLSALDMGVQRLVNPLGSIYDRLNRRSSYGLPCDFGLMNSMRGF